MEPAYQRRSGIWDASDRSFLIDSILNDYDIPKFYFADFSLGSAELNPNRKAFAVIDGKQRLEAIFGFFDGRVLLPREFLLLEDHSLRLGGLGLKDLRVNHPKLARRFENFNLAVVSVLTDEEARINELFVRLNRSRPLTGAEVRNAMGGVVPTIIRRIAAHAFFEEKIPFSKKRAADQNAAAKLLLCEFRGDLVDTRKTDLDRFTTEGLRAEAEADDFKRAGDRVLQILDRMVTIFTPTDPLLSEGSVPVYYWLTRELPVGVADGMRTSLVQFDELRRVARRNLSVDPNAPVPRLLVLYEGLSRSVNSARSLVGRYQILRLVLENGVQTIQA